MSDTPVSSQQIAPGVAAPSFSMPRDGGGSVALSDFAGRTLVLYFYPKDDTSGCTKEAIGFTEKLAAFEAAGASVVGVSKDSVAKHDKFIAKHDLGVILASDEDGRVCEDYGVWVEKSMYGKTYMGIERATFVIDGDGVVRHVWRKVKVPGHVDAVLAALEG
jgi:peroxiredoxin Q/BCP